MARIILEDMKLNKERRKLPPKEEVVFRPKQIVKESNKEEIKNGEAKPACTKSSGKVKEESMIEEYIQSKSSSRQRLERTPQVKRKKTIIHKPVLILLVIFIFGGGIYWGGNTFQKADITLTSKHEFISYKDKQFIASKDVNINAVDFDIMITSDKKYKNITLTEPTDVSIKAKGSITLYNEFGITPQKLLSGTFIADNEGKAYKTDSIVTIPGYKVDNNKKIIPGQAAVNITAFLPGDSYNGEPTDFYINSFKNTPKYNKIYGKLKTPLVGGASGLMYTLNDKDKESIDKMAQSSFKEDLLKQVRAQVPPGYILYPNAFSFSYKTGDSILSKTPEAKIEIEETLSVVLLKEKSLLDHIIKVSLPNIKGDELKEVKIPDLDKLSFSFINKDQIITKDLTSISFFFTGDLNVIWAPEVEILKTKLLGIYKDETLSIFRQDPGIASALIKIFPPWQKYIPQDLAKINIIIN